MGYQLKASFFFRVRAFKGFPKIMRVVSRAKPGESNVPVALPRRFPWNKKRCKP
jgi:hypothetical protein